MALERAETLQVFLREMLFKPDEDRELHETLKRLTEALATTLKVERVSIWRYALEPTRIVCRYFHPKSSGMEGTASAHSWVVWASWRDCCLYGIPLLEFVCVSLLVV